MELSASRLQTGPVVLYAQLANILRDRVTSGVWKTGEETPTLEELVAEFGVARVTVRQAIQILVEEGLLSSQRGRRTFVTYAVPTTDANPLYSSIGSMNDEGADLSVQILSREELGGIPPHYAGPGVVIDRYMRIRKMDLQNGLPYGISDNYVSLPLYKRFPINADSVVKISRLVRDYSRPKLARGFERVTVSTVSFEEATLLKVPLGAPVARVLRVLMGGGDKIAYWGMVAYRGDRYKTERDISDLLR